MSREEILGFAQDPEGRKQLQAALKWIDRNKALLKEVLSREAAPVLRIPRAA